MGKLRAGRDGQSRRLVEGAGGKRAVVRGHDPINLLFLWQRVDVVGQARQQRRRGPLR